MNAFGSEVTSRIPECLTLSLVEFDGDEDALRRFHSTYYRYVSA